MSLVVPIIFLVACNAAPADHFGAFANQLKKEGYEVHVCAASGSAYKNLQAWGVSVDMQFSLDNLDEAARRDLAAKVAETCAKASVVITDVGHAFDMDLQEALKKQGQAKRVVYYDNPEPYVPGGYSEVAKDPMEKAHKVFFANANLATSILYQRPNEVISLPFRKSRRSWILSRS